MNLKWKNNLENNAEASSIIVTFLLFKGRLKPDPKDKEPEHSGKMTHHIVSQNKAECT